MPSTGSAHRCTPPFRSLSCVPLSAGYGQVEQLDSRSRDHNLLIAGIQRTYVEKNSRLSWEEKVKGQREFVDKVSCAMKRLYRRGVVV